jgi:hypothetical protein
MKSNFPMEPHQVSWLPLDEWRNSHQPWPFPNTAELAFLGKFEDEDLVVKRILAGEVPLFSNLDHGLEVQGWNVHPETKYEYPLDHWTDIPDFDPIRGDIKYVWERSRFSHHLRVMRFDARHGTDHSAWVLGEILSWIEANPINRGPQWRCSQEISIRLLNWWFLLRFYRHSPHLSEVLWATIQNVIYWQVHHVRNNIQFSRIAVRNNHAITETALLLLVPHLFPGMPNGTQWAKLGKGWFEQEIQFQVFPDGSYLQFSMTYQRVVMQVVTSVLAFERAGCFVVQLSTKTRLNAFLHFMKVCQDPVSGWLPNYGANDGALFYPLSRAHYRDFNPQINALQLLLKGKPHLVPPFAMEEALWWGLHSDSLPLEGLRQGWHRFDEGGFYVWRSNTELLMIRCGKHRVRPSQADNLHLDYWRNGTNVLCDAGSFKYNTSIEELMYFVGTQGHNALTVNGQDQMEKGPRFVWFHWSQAVVANLSEDHNFVIFEGEMKAFGHVSPNLHHKRKVVLDKVNGLMTVSDELNGLANPLLTQHWHTLMPENIFLESPGNTIKMEEGWYSENYGQRVKNPHWLVESNNTSIASTIHFT